MVPLVSTPGHLGGLSQCSTRPTDAMRGLSLSRSSLRSATERSRSTMTSFKGLPPSWVVTQAERFLKSAGQRFKQDLEFLVSEISFSKFRRMWSSAAGATEEDALLEPSRLTDGTGEATSAPVLGQHVEDSDALWPPSQTSTGKHRNQRLEGLRESHLQGLSIAA